MRRGMIVRPEAATDAIEACRWYDQRVIGLGKRFLDEIDVLMASIQDVPQQYPVYVRDIRRARLRSFPYAIFFAADEAKVVVLAVLHLYRDPRLIHRIVRQR